MIIRMADCIGRTYVGAGETGYAIFDMLDYTEGFFLVKLKNLGRTDVDTEFASPARLFMNGNIK